MSLPLLVLWGAAVAAAPDPAAARPPAPSPSQQALYDLLKLRHVPADLCPRLSALTDTLEEDVAFLVDHAQQPAWVAPRAAACLLREAPDAGLRAARTWMVRDDRRGLALVALGELDRLPAAGAVALAHLARQGPLGADAVPRLQRSAREAVRAVAALPEDAVLPVPADGAVPADAP